MKNEKVRCWKVGLNNELFITYPEGDMGHRLICCKSCGKVHSASVAKQLYIEPDLEKHLSNIQCMGCSSSLADNWAFYPENYLAEDGKLQQFERAYVIPDDNDSLVVEFPEVFS
jgi:hypothetical protein